MRKCKAFTPKIMSISRSLALGLPTDTNASPTRQRRGKYRSNQWCGIIKSVDGIGQDRSCHHSYKWCWLCRQSGIHASPRPMIFSSSAPSKFEWTLLNTAAGRVNLGEGWVRFTVKCSRYAYWRFISGRGHICLAWDSFLMKPYYTIFINKNPVDSRIQHLWRWVVHVARW